MRDTIARVAILWAGAALIVGATAAGHPSVSLPACETEDQTTACYWDASEQGNGQGSDFWVDENGEVHYV